MQSRIGSMIGSVLLALAALWFAFHFVLGPVEYMGAHPDACWAMDPNYVAAYEVPCSPDR